jgi:DNA-binding beta-propeller fold protein YncE
VDGADPGCLRASYGSEDPVVIGFGDLLVLDRRSGTLLRLDVASGVQTPISVGAALTDPQGLAVRPSGAIVVADPAGLFEIAPGTGAQRRFTGALAAGVSLQVVFDAAGDPVVLTKTGLVRAPWAWAGLVATAPLLTLPVPGSIGVFQGDALAREASGALLVGGFGLLGDGIYRIAADGSSTSKLTPGFSGDVWQDFAVEADGSVLAAGTRFGVGPGVFRVHPATGAVAALATGPDWTAPSAVAVAPDGRVFAADAGACTPAAAPAPRSWSCTRATAPGSTSRPAARSPERRISSWCRRCPPATTG